MALVTEIFADFASAAAACGPGYDSGVIADVIAYKTALGVDPRHFAPEQAVNSIISIGIATAEITERPLRVLDFGGGCGFHYFRVSAALRSKLRWAVVETKTMAERARKVAGDRFDAFTDLSDAAGALGRVHLVHASSSIQYVPEPLSTLKGSCDASGALLHACSFSCMGAPSDCRRADIAFGCERNWPDAADYCRPAGQIPNHLYEL